MSVEALGRALGAPIGKSPKLVLIGLANHAHPDGSHAYPSVPTLATYAHCDPRTVHRCLRELEALGWLERTGRMPDGRAVYRLVFAAWETPDKLPPPAPDKLPPPHDAHVTPPLTPTSPEPSVNRQTSVDSPGSRATADDLDLDLEDLAEQVRGILQRGIDGLTTDEPVRPPGRGAVLEALRAHPLPRAEVLGVAVEVRSITQAQDRAPNVVGLLAQRLNRRCAELAAISAPVEDSVRSQTVG